MVIMMPAVTNYHKHVRPFAPPFPPHRPFAQGKARTGILVKDLSPRCKVAKRARERAHRVSRIKSRKKKTNKKTITFDQGFVMKTSANRDKPDAARQL